ncbi:MAG: TetR/AcrR family transcriptional regulator [Thermoleophilia bacterium]|nr:TetR/AcrR family transcriptional regulator [Thermoleophilia bacterium]
MPGRPRPLAFWDARRERVLTAACAEAAEAGVDGLTLDRVARRAGMSKGALQYAFGSKEELVGGLARWLLFTIYSEGVGAQDPDEPRSLREVVDALSRGLGGDEDRLVALVSLLATARRSPSAAAALAAFYAEADPRIAAALQEAGVDVPRDELMALARGVRGVVLGMFTHWTVFPQSRSREDVAREIGVVLERLVAGARERTAA